MRTCDCHTPFRHHDTGLVLCKVHASEDLDAILTAIVSAPTETGMSRLSLSDADKSARDWFASTTKALGCKVAVDEMGNQFAVRPGRKDDAPTFAGSHLDTQPTGGRYDGILGVTAAVEMLKVLKDHHVETEYPVGVVNWTNEEGARFPISMVSSGVWAGKIPLEKAHGLRSVVGNERATMKSELERIGYLGSVKASPEGTPIAAHFELHIEQGPILESSQRKIGVVQGVQAYKWFTIDVKGRDCHTGTTNFANRADALLTASKLMLHSHRAATKAGALASTGILTLQPGSTNTVPGIVRFSLDIRAAKDETVEIVEAECKDAFERIARGEDVGGLQQGCTPGLPCTVDWTTDSVSPAIKFHPDCISCVESAAHDLLGKEKELTMPMTSGAGHDSVYASKVCPTSMIFVPCRDGVSHNPSEFSEPEDCANGAQVLLGAVLRYDRLRAERAA